MIRFGSGCYNVYNCERSDHPLNLMSNNLNRYITCQITFLDNTQHSFQIERHSKGQILLDKVFDYLELVEKDYFGLQFTSFVETNQIDAGIRKWLDPTKSVRKQMLCPPFNLFFRVKFYVSDPVKLVEEYTRYHIFLQIKKDLYEGRLVCPENICTILASYAVQSEFGDYCPEEHGDHYLNDFKFIPNQDNNFLSKVVDLHKIRKGQTPAQAEFNFLEVAKTTELYGIELFNAKDEDGNSVNIGCCNRGIIIFRSNQQQNIFQWTTIMKLAFKKKLFSVYMKDEKSDDEIVRVFNMQNPEVCKVLWKNCIEHHTFFRLVAPPALPQKSFFNIGSRYRYSGKTEFQSIEEMKRRARVERSFQRNPSRLTATNNGNGQYTQPAVTDNSSNVHSISSSQIWFRKFLRRRRSRIFFANSYNTTKQQNTLLLLSLEAPNKMDMETISPKSKRDLIPILVEKQSSRKEVTSVDTVLSGNIHSNENDYNVSNLSHLSLNLNQINKNGAKTKGELLKCTKSDIVCRETASTKVNNRTPIEDVVQASTSTLIEGTINGYNKSQVKDFLSNTDSCGFTSGSAVNRFAPGANVSGSPYRLRNMKLTTIKSPRSSITSHSSINSINLVNNTSPTHRRKSPCLSVGEDNLVVVRMKPDQHGRYGFNVKGGADQNYPVIVSRVAPGGAADKCNPRLNEGDQVLFINGLDVSHLSHDHVVRFIRSLKEANNGELVLTVRPNVYRCGEDISEYDQHVPESQHVADSVSCSDILEQSLILLKEALASGQIVSQFEKLYRKKPGMSMEDCKQPFYVNKNRYRDVYPYDETRVRINAPSGDYINASFVNMEIPTSGIVNRYIAAQGPLANTSDDFWYMIWDHLCTTIIMLTTTVERGRIKCHQYWPSLYEKQDYGKLTISNIQERELPNCVYREISIKDKITREERRVTHMQYTAWPDHGVPSDQKYFIEFVDEVRKIRVGSVDPIVVHCSAGIGRTGVLILMETAACLVEANEPVYPLEIVRVMRDQRAMLIQTAEQYKFVCECILKAYNDGAIRPLPEYYKKS